MYEDYDWEEGRRRKRLLLLALIIIALVGLSTWGGVRIGSATTSNEIATLQNKVSSMESDAVTLAANYSALQSQVESEYATLESSYSQLQSQYDTLSQTYTSQQKQLAIAEDYASQLQEDLDNLQANYISLTQLKKFDVDDKLQVNFTAEDEFLTSRWIAGQVTNIGSTTVNKVYVFVFRYDPDGSLKQAEFPPTVITNLKPDETAHFSFLVASEPFKIMVVGDY